MYLYIYNWITARIYYAVLYLCSSGVLLISALFGFCFLHFRRRIVWLLGDWHNVRMPIATLQSSAQLD